jgi:hypothetical protein
VIPQDVHSVLDYANVVRSSIPAFFAESPEARFTSLALGASVLSVSLITDYRLSLANVIPIEVHEAIDYLWAGAAIAAPFVLGYHKKDRLATMIHVVTGVTTILVSLITDYRAAKGRGRHAVEAATMMGAKLQPGASAYLEYAP